MFFGLAFGGCAGASIVPNGYLPRRTNLGFSMFFRGSPKRQITSGHAGLDNAELQFSEVQQVPGCPSEELWRKATAVACQTFQSSDARPRVLVTGGALWPAISCALRGVVACPTFFPSDCACHLDLERDVCLRDLTRENATENLVEGADIVYHLADVVAAIGFVFGNQEWLFRQNVLINTNVLKAAVLSSTRALVVSRWSCNPPMMSLPCMKAKHSQRTLNLPTGGAS